MATETSRLDAIEAVYRARAADFFRVALATTRDVERAHDAVQEGFARAIRHRDGFRGSGSLEAWICRCVLNAARDERSELSPGLTLGDEPSPLAALDEPDETVRNAIFELPLRQREALFLRYYLDFDYAQIADVLGVRVGTVSATLHAARAALEQALTEVAQ
ncbi:MAG: RNA polymerase sigma factor [Actinobacteria bacterium]|nr:RNA polymerase sigma factor [Actinomycetota bacterium]